MGMTFVTNVAQYKIMLLLAELDEGKKSLNELAAAIPMTREAVWNYLAHIGVRVAGWHIPGDGNFVPLYDRKPLPDVPRPPRTESETERKRRVWREIKRDPERITRVRAVQRAARKRRADGWNGAYQIY